MRIDAQTKVGEFVPDLSELCAPEILTSASAYAVATYRHSRLPLRMFEAARVATAAINGCITCMNWRTALHIGLYGITDGVDSAGPAPDDAFYDLVLADDLAHLDHRETLAVRYVQKMGTAPRELSEDDAFWREFKQALTDAEIVDLTYCAAGWIGFGRAFHALGLDRVCALPRGDQIQTVAA